MHPNATSKYAPHRLHTKFNNLEYINMPKKLENENCTLQIVIMFNKILWWVSKATKWYTQLLYLLCKVEDHG
jgi:hypothetical protein